MSDLTIVGTDANFTKEVLESDRVTIVDFWAPWCGPCKAIAPMLDEIAKNPALKIVKVNVDENKAVAAGFGIRSIPTMMIFKDGEKAATKVGSGSRSDLDSWIAANS